MLSEEQIEILYYEVMGGDLTHLRVKFARAIEREATVQMLEQIKKDEALMRKAMASLDDYKDGVEWGAYDMEILTALRQCLENKK